MLSLLAAVLIALNCTQPPPGVGWVCQDGGWLPPGHPWIRSVDGTTAGAPSANPFRAPLQHTPPDAFTESVVMTNAEIQAAAWSGTPLPAKLIKFTPPLRLRDIASLKGTAGRTWLSPDTTAPGPLIFLEAALNHPIRQVLEDITILCASPKQTGLVINGQSITIDRLTVLSCDEGVNIGYVVNAVVRDSRIAANRVGVFVMGYGPTGISGPNSVTTLRFSGTHIFLNSEIGIRIGHGISIVLDNSTIIEGNTKIGLLVEPTFPGAIISVVLRDVWFELNGQHIVDRLGVVRFEGFTGGH